MTKKTAIVTGAGGGIGRATARKIASHGIHVYATDINDDLGKQTTSIINDEGGEATYLHLDISKKEEVNRTIDTIINDSGHLTYAVNNAGIGGVISPLHEVREEDWNRMIQVNLTGQFFCMRKQLAVMAAQGGGSIVNVSSVAGVSGVARGGPYSAAKHGLIGLTKSAAREYSEFNIRINAVCPGFIETEMITPIPSEVLEFSKSIAIPMKRFGQVEEVADTIYYLLSHQSTYITGTAMIVDGGMKAG
jgi:NAD(P)-dependent dehydrogenase (short-subunit alcohol dehydrogenase family)